MGSLTAAVSAAAGLPLDYLGLAYGFAHGLTLHSENINLHRNRDRDEAAVFCKAWHNRQKGSDKKRYFKAVFHGVAAAKWDQFEITLPVPRNGIVKAKWYFLAAFFRSLTSTCHS